MENLEHSRTLPTGKAPLSIRRRIVFSLAMVILVWACCEGAMLVFWAVTPPQPPGSRFCYMYMPHPYRAFCLRPSIVDREGKSSNNSLGLRGPEISLKKPEGTIRILCLGGSTTIGIEATTNSHTYPARMEAILRSHYADAPWRIEVLNAGLSASNSLESLIYFQTRLLDFSPDVAVFHHGINDTFIMAWQAGFKSDNSHARIPFHINPPRWWEISPFLSYWFVKRSIHNPYFPNRHPNLNELVIKDPYSIADKDLRGQKGMRADMLAAYRRNVVNFIHIARGNGVIPVISTQVHYDDSREKNGKMFRSTQQIHALLRDLAEGESVDLIDFAQAMKWSSTSFSDACHLKDTEEGLGAKARIFAKALIDNRVIERAHERRVSSSTWP